MRETASKSWKYKHFRAATRISLASAGQLVAIWRPPSWKLGLAAPQICQKPAKSLTSTHFRSPWPRLGTPGMDFPFRPPGRSLFPFKPAARRSFT
jgi:hypothetical protein